MTKFYRFLMAMIAISIVLNLSSCSSDDSNEQCTTHAQAIVVMSDLHLGEARGTAGGFNPCVKNKANLIGMLDYLIKNNHSFSKLVFNGDLFEEWQFPLSMKIYADNQGNDISHVEFLRSIERENSDFFNRLRQLKQLGIEIIYVNGNHDMCVNSSTLSKAFPNLFTYYGNDKGAGRYQPTEDIDIEHSHIYDYSDSPIPSQNENGFDIPDGLFITKIQTDDALQGGSLESIADPVKMQQLAQTINAYASQEQNTQLMMGVNAFYWKMLSETFTHIDYTKPFATGIANLQGNYYFNQFALADQQGTPGSLYASQLNPEAWENRCRLNGATCDVNFTKAIAAWVLHNYIDDLAFEHFLDNADSDVKIVIFSHTHTPVFTARQSTVANKGNVVYVNTGYWCDNGLSEKNTFAFIETTDSGYKVSLKHFANSDKIEVIGETTIQK